VELLDDLGYVEKFSRKYGIDIASDPPGSEHPFIRFPFSPNGRTAFEFTSEANVSVENETSTLLDKIGKVNSKHGFGIKGGVLITDVRLSEKLIGEAQKRKVFCWDTRALSLLASKVSLSRGISQSESGPVEVPEYKLDAWTTFLIRLLPYTGYTEGRILAFYQNPLQTLDVEILDSVIKKLEPNISTRVRDLGGKVVFGFQIHSLAEISEGVYKRFDKHLSTKPGAKWVFENEKCGLFSYARAPWSGFLQSSKGIFPWRVPSTS
jgi:hypothetical protein